MRPGRLIGISAMVILLLLLLIGDGALRDNTLATSPETTISSSQSTSATPSNTVMPQTPTPTPILTPSPVVTPTPTCSTASGSIVPKRMVIDRLGIDVAVDQTPLAADGSVPVPVDGNGNDVRWAATWINNTPRPGAAGVADFTTHAFHQGDAVGNRLATTAAVGDVIRLIDAGGKQLCFQISSINLHYPAAKLPVNDLYNAGGPSRMAIVFCTDYDFFKAVWPNRGVVMANLV